MSGPDLVERLRAKHDRWQKQCDDWIRVAKANGQDIATSIDSIRPTLEGEAAAELSTLRSRCETLEAERDEAFEQCAKIAEWDMRTPMAISAGHKPEWYKHGLSIAKRIRNLAGRATQPARKEKG